MRPALLCFVLSILLPGCAQEPMRWTKADFDPKALERDLNECDIAARTSAASKVPGRSMGLGSQANTPGASTASVDRFQLETEARRDCMQARGYREARP